MDALSSFLYVLVKLVPLLAGSLDLILYGEGYDGERDERVMMMEVEESKHLAGCVSNSSLEFKFELLPIGRDTKSLVHFCVFTPYPLS